MWVHRPLGPVLVFGEVLFDHFENGKRLGGAPFNYAFHMHKLGFPVYFISRVGDDAEGREIFEFARRHEFPTEGIQVDPDHATGAVQVSMDSQGGHKFEILPDRAYDYIELDPYVQKLLNEDIPLVYYGTLAQRNSVSAETLKAILKKLGSKSTFLLDINLRAPFYSRDLVESALKSCDVLKLNMDELKEIKGLLGIDTPLLEMARYLEERYRLGLVCVTNGSKGCYLIETGTTKIFECKPDDSATVIDSVGAGDAFSAMLSAGYLAGWPKQTVLERACLFATGICGIQGALPEDDAFYEPFEFQFQRK